MSINLQFFIGIGLFCIALLLYLLSPIITPFIIAGLLAYLGNPLVNILVRWKLPRTAAVIIVFILIFILFLLLVLLLAPILDEQFSLLLTNLPQLLIWIQEKALPWCNTHLGLSLDFNNIKSTVMSHWQQVGNIAAVLVKTVTHSGQTIITWALYLFLIPVVTFYLLRDWEDILKAIYALIPNKMKSLITLLVKECNEVIGAFFRGQLIVMIVLGLIYAIGLSICGINVALLIGIFSGLLSIVPYLGFIVGILAAATAAIIQYHDTVHLIYILIVYILGHIIEGFILTPWLVGDKIGLHPVAVIFAILAGGQLFGFIGILVALPAAAVIMVLLRFLKHRYIQSQFFK